MLKRRQECDTYLTHICRRHSSGSNTEKRLTPLWVSSAVDITFFYIGSTLSKNDINIKGKPGTVI